MRKAIILLLGLLAAVPAAAARDYGSDPHRIILTFDVTGGQKPRRNEGPMLEIAADGEFSTRATYPGDPRIVGQLSEAERDALFDQVLDEHAALSIDSDAIAAALKQANISPRRIADAPTTTLSLNLDEKTHSVSVYAVSASAAQLPGNAMLDDLFSIQRILMDLVRKVAAD